MKTALMKMTIYDRYAFIREVYAKLNQDFPLTVEILQISRNTLYNALTILNPSPIVHDRKLKEEHRIYIHSRTITEPTISGDALAKELYDVFQIDVKGRTVNNYRKEMGLNFRPPIRSVYISPPAVTKRFNFTKFHLDQHNDFKNVVFSDESWFVLGKNSRWVWVDMHQITDKVLQNKVAHPPKVMIWGAVGYNYKSDLIIVKGTLNSENYIDQIIFGSNLIETADAEYGIGNWLFMQDNARPHVSRETIDVLKELEIDLLPDWPPYSPDLNIIEVIWAIMEARVSKYQPRTVDQLINIIKDVWENLTFQTINGLVEEMPERLRKVNAKPQQSIHYYSK